MKAEYLESYVSLKTLEPGQVAVSRDRKHTFLCCWVSNPSHTDCFSTIIDLANPTYQYIHNTNLDQPVKIIPTGDRFVIIV